MAALDAPPPTRRGLIAQTLAAAGLLAWRVGERDWADLRWDLLTYLAVFWLLDLHVRHPKVRPWLVPLAVLGLFAAYALRHLPLLLVQIRHSL